MAVKDVCSMLSSHSRKLCLLNVNGWLTKRMYATTLGDKIIEEVKSARKFKKIIYSKEIRKLQRKKLADKFLIPGAKFESTALSLSARGFCREKTAYKPSEDTEDQLKRIIQEVFENSEIQWKEISLSDPYLKYKLLARCIQHFKHDIPNSILHKMKTVADVVEYFLTPVAGILPYDVMVRDNNKLPPNLHILPDYMRFHPETDTMFGGISAYPKSVTIVSGLKAKKKFRGYDPNPPLPKIL